MRRQLLWWGGLSVGIGAATAAYIGHAMPDFVAMFQGFGSDLPAVTRLVLDWPHALWAMPALALAILLVGLLRPLTREGYRRAMLTLVTIAAATVVVGLLVVAALYAPIFTLGEAI